MTARAPRVVHACLEPFYGEGYTRLVRLVPALREAGVESALVCAASSRLALAGRELGVEPVEVAAGAPLDPRVVVALARAFARLRPGVVHVHGEVATGPPALAARVRGVPVVRTFLHASSGATRFVTRAIGTTRVVTDELALLRFGDRATYVPDGIDPATLVTRVPRDTTRGAEGASPDDFVLLSLSSLEEGRGHETLLLAMARLAEASVRPVLWIAGDGPTLVSVDHLRRELGLAGNTRVLGRRANVADLLEACDALVHPSLEPHAGKSVLEAMARGRAVVASRLGGPAELVEDGETGLLVPPGEPFALSEALRSLVLDRERSRRAGAAGARRVAERFSSADSARAHAELYAAVARRPAR